MQWLFVTTGCNTNTGPAAVALPAAVLNLRDEGAWGLAAADEYGGIAVHRLREIMGLRPIGNSSFEPLLRGRFTLESVSRTRRTPSSGIPGALVQYFGDCAASKLPLSMWLSDHGGLCRLEASVAAPVLRIQLSIIAQAIARQIQDRDGLLLHGALAELDGAGLILAGPSGVGKTTASDRLPPPWRSRSDDAVLVVRGAEGRYRAHPWPTWSRLQFTDNLDHGWDVERAVPLAGICFLDQSATDSLEQMRSGPTATLTVRSSEQAAMLMPYTSRADRFAKRIQRLENACALARSVRGYRLELSPSGAFWRLLEDIVTAGGDVGRASGEAVCSQRLPQSGRARIQRQVRS